MSISVAFLSGKGGSGKTTLALSIADLLRRSGTKTLLVDCDMSTNGATYFYEAQLKEWNRERPVGPSSFFDVLYGNYCDYEPLPLKIDPLLDFIPSISEVSGKYMSVSIVQDIAGLKPRLNNFLSWANGAYDVILFDCQAGYSEYLPLLLPWMDTDLFVLEADSISASAMRSLHLKIGSYFSGARLYQVFNKATREEFEIYSKITGTFFTNIGTLLFDWKIRQAFSRSQLPDLTNTSANYGYDLCGVCQIIFQGGSVQERLVLMSKKLRYRQLAEEQKELEKLLDTPSSREDYPQRRIVRWVYFSSLIPILFSAMLFLLVSITDLKVSTDFSWYVLTVGVASSFVILLIVDTLSTSREARARRSKYLKQLREIETELKNLERLSHEDGEQDTSSIS